MAGSWTVIVAGAALALIAGCAPSAEEQAANQTAVQPKKERPPYCFFKDQETAGWALKIAGDQAVVTGRGYRSDPRYMVVLLEPKLAGRVAEIRPTIAVNDTGFATADNWWDLKAIVPAGSIDAVEVRCGAKVVATLAVAAPKR